MIRVPFSGDRWPGTTITYGFPDKGFHWGDCKPEGYERDLADDWSPLTAEDRDINRQVAASIAASTGLRFKEVEPDEAQIRVARSANVKAFGYGFHPGRRHRRSGALFHHPDLSGKPSQPGTRRWTHRLHEWGHCLGLEHAKTNDPWEAVMAQEWPELDSYPRTLREPDVEAVRRAYGL